MFSFKNKNAPSDSQDKVYMTGEEKIEAMTTDILAAAHIYDAVMVIAFFHDQLTALRSEMDEQGVAYRYFDSLHQRYETVNAAGNQTVRVLLLPSEVLKGMSGGLSEEKEGEVAVIVAGHHPKAETDDLVLALTRAMKRKSVVTFYQSFEDELLKVFGGERLSNLMTQMGMVKGEPVSHPLVSSSIRKAQEKLQERIVSDLPAGSEAEWFRINISAK
ncbi:MAG: hypothetical protein AMXMBFR48_28580 [Ignavibacteriales bacterium]